MDLGKMADEGCNDECSYDRKCLNRADWYAAYDLRRTFWGKPEDNPFMPKKRMQQIVNIYKYCEVVKVNFISCISRFFLPSSNKKYEVNFSYIISKNTK